MLSQPVRSWADEDVLVSTGPGFAAGGARPSTPVPRLPRTPVPTGPSAPSFGPDVSYFSGPLGPLDLPPAPRTSTIPERNVHARGADARGADTGANPAVTGRAAQRAERQAVDVARRKVAKRMGEPDPLAQLDPEESATRRAPRRIVLALVAMTVVALGVLGVYSFTSPRTQPAASGSDTTTPATDSREFAAPTAVLPPLVAEPLAVDPVPASPIRVPVTVLNATAINGLAGRVAESIAADGWETPATGGYTASDVAASTVFFTEGDDTQRQAAMQLIEQFPALQGPAERFFELPADLTAPGLVVVLAGDWEP